MIIRGSELDRPLNLRADVIVIGSGAGGAVIAKELTQAGKDVLILEEGRYVRPQVYSQWRPSMTLRRIARSGGTTAAIGIGDSPTINIHMASCVGGSSVMTGGVCFRIPSEVHAEWVEQLGVSSLSEQAMQPFYERVEKAIHVQEVPESMRSKGTQLFGQGAERMGLSLRPLSRNTKDCCGCSSCNFGCPHLAKLSVDLTYLPIALAGGAKILADHRVERILVLGDRVIGVEGVILREPDRQPKARFVAHAPTVVLAAGTLHTPGILRKSKIGRNSGQLGANVTLHPAFRIAGVFDEPVENWKGALQSAYCEHPSDKNLIFVSVMAPPSVLTAMWPGVGPSFMQHAKNLGHLATFGGMIHDKPGGRIWPSLGREPLFTYQLAPEDRASMFEGIRFLATCYFEAGARMILLPILGSQPLHSIDELNRIDFSRTKASRVECLSFHPLGSCRMGTDPYQAVTSPSGEVFDVRGLWIADGSIFPTSVGVNTQIPIMTMATRIAFDMIDSSQHRWYV